VTLAFEAGEEVDRAGLHTGVEAAADGSADEVSAERGAFVAIAGEDTGVDVPPPLVIDRGGVDLPLTAGASRQKRVGENKRSVMMVGRAFRSQELKVRCLFPSVAGCYRGPQVGRKPVSGGGGGGVEHDAIAGSL